MAERKPQLDYSQQMAAMLDEQKRRQKAAKILAVLRHALGRPDLTGLTALDVGCSAGYIADELAKAGATTHGVDIDEGGVALAKERFGADVTFHLSDAEHLPFEDDSVDVVVLNHIYEHVVDPAAVVAEIHRVLSPDGVAYFGLANRLGIIEPHHRLPFLSWLPPKAGDAYVRITRKGDQYYERLRTRRSLEQLLNAFDLWDYTVPVLADPQRYSGGDIVPGLAARLPRASFRALMPIIPTYLWVGFKTPHTPAGSDGSAPPVHV
ncbi:ubiquinone biosynthesis methyltransferase UbiE [Phycicoccus sp. Root563]|uniref:class I SAM-dependent methyltransferase n=1 Tax=Phycicoccus sp. Root563 TaxID=1736562 RepID=UPI000703ADE2|nr:class I SAM-dependent methyltransferase [Phycicoccus sp. Root563]KQZ89805.1 ubiquinone biosynthesis methyltransferase UbiE [Phycicoccus sp. Root563]